MEWVCAQQRYTRRKQTLSAQPKACFATTASGSCLCVLEGSSVTMHLANGDTHVVALPCKAVGLWALPAGVLVEPPRADGGPVAHLLNEPLEELRTVVMTRASASAEPPGDILLSSARAPLVLTHQPRARAHALWRVAGGGTPGGAAELAAWWEQPAGSAASAAESSFFAPEDGGAGVGELPLLLCVAQPERELLHVYSLGAPAAAPPPTRRPLVVDEAAAAPGATPRVSTVGALPAVAAQPVRGCGAGSGAGGGGGSGGVARILALGADGSLALWQCGSSGVHCLLRCSNDVLAPHAGWPTVSPAMAMAAATPGAGAARSTLYGCAPRVDSLVLKTAQGAEMRAQLLRPADDPLVRQCLSALRRVLPAAAYEQLSLGLVCHSLAMAPADYVGAPDAPSLPWRDFSEALLALLGAADPAAAAAGPIAGLPAADGGADGAPSAAWSAMLRSPVHLRCAGRAPLQCLLPASAAANAAAPAVGAASLAPTERYRALVAMHTVYEALKLSTLSWPLVEPLGKLLTAVASLAGRQEFVSHYSRDLGAVPTHRVAGAVMPPPLCLTSWLCAALDALPAAGAGGASPPLAPPPAEAVADLPPGATAPLVAAVVELYALVRVGAGGDHSAAPSLRPAATALPPAGRLPHPVPPDATGLRAHCRLLAAASEALPERLVLLMASHGLSLRQLEVLPIGVALPLQVGLQAEAWAPTFFLVSLRTRNPPRRMPSASAATARRRAGHRWRIV